jgi:putative transposase
MEKKINYWTGAHTKHKLRYHIVWVPKYRKRILIGKLLIRLEELLYQVNCAHLFRQLLPNLGI